MSVRLLVVFILLFSMPVVGFASTVNITSEVYEDKTEFTYDVRFNASESYDSFSFEKPRDARLLTARDGANQSLRYTAAGDYFILRPDTTEGKRFLITFTSVETSRNIKENNAFSTYVNFNVPVEALSFHLRLEDPVGETTEVFPRNYRVGDGGDITWMLDSVERDTLFLVNFRNTDDSGFGLPALSGVVFYGALFGLFFVVLGGLAGALVYFKLWDIRRLPFQRRQKQSDQQQSPSEHQEATASEKQRTQLDVKTVVEKYLTENEGEVVEVIEKHPGISQYDILNYLPHLSKSNLSKIVAKLHNKRYLNRIKVGKVNKIYLGEKLVGSEEHPERE